MSTVYDRVGSTFFRSSHDHADGSFTLYNEQDLTEIIEENKRLAENQTGKEMMRLAARVPVAVTERAMREGWFHDDDAWAKWMNDPENRDHRVYQGRI